MRRLPVILVALTAMTIFVNCTYVPVPLPQKYKLASEEYVNSQVAIALAQQTGSLIDSIRQETQALVNESIDSILAAQGEIQSLVEENRKLQTDLQTAMADQTATLDAQSKRLTEINKLITDINLIQGELVKNVESIPMTTLLTLQKALATYRPQPLLVSKPAPVPEKIPAPQATSSKSKTAGKAAAPVEDSKPKPAEVVPEPKAEDYGAGSSAEPDSTDESSN